METNSSLSRKDFLRSVCLAGVGLTISSSLNAFIKVNGSKKLGVALVGLGNYSTYQLAPALQKTNNCYLAGIVTGTKEKEIIWSDKYGIKPGSIYDYDNFDSIKDNSDIDIVYVVLPVAMHKDFVIRAAKAKKNVICEKPMAMNVSECFEMIEACKSNGVKFSIGYRLHFEPFNLEIMHLGQQKSFGKIQNIVTSNGFVYSGPADNWRLKKNMAGGGGLMDMGIYALHAARFVMVLYPKTVLLKPYLNQRHSN
jgi:predicted dehydrogenase